MQSCPQAEPPQTPQYGHNSTGIARLSALRRDCLRLWRVTGDRLGRCGRRRMAGCSPVRYGATKRRDLHRGPAPGIHRMPPSWSCSNERTVVGRPGSAWQPGSSRSAPLHAFPQLCAAVMGGFSHSQLRGTVPWLSEGAWNAAHRPTGCPSPFHPIRLMLAGPARTQSELGRFNAPSSSLPLFVLHQRGDGAEMEAESEGVGLHEASPLPKASSSRQHQHQHQRQPLSARTMLASTGLVQHSDSWRLAGRSAVLGAE